MTEPIGQKNYSNSDVSSDVFAVNRSLLIWLLAFAGVYIFLPEAGWSDLFVALLMLGVLWLLARTYNNRFFSLADVNWRVNVVVVTGILLLSILTETGFILFFEAFSPQQLDTIILSQTPSTQAFILAILSIGLLAPLAEEYLFRWVLLRAFASVRSSLFAALLSSFLFALVHGTPVYAVIVFPMGFMLALYVLKTGQLWSAVIVHVLANVYALAITQFGPTPESYAEVPVTPLVGIAGLTVALGALLLAVLWLGLPSRQVETRGPLWSGSLVAFVTITVLFSIIATFSV